MFTFLKDIPVARHIGHPAAGPISGKRRVVDFLSGFSVETTPNSARKVGDFTLHLRPETRVFVTWLPGSDFNETIDCCLMLKEQGFRPVPHIGARSVPDEPAFSGMLGRLQATVGVDEALLVGGGLDRPVGRITHSMQLLETGLFEAHGITRIGVAGHPEGSPDIPDDEMKRALHEKNEYAARTGTDLHMVTQFCFEAAPIIGWDHWLRAEGNRLPVSIGIAGLATVKTLLAHAKACGVGASMRVLTRSSGNLTKLMAVKSPGRLVADLADHVANDPATCIKGVHMFPLGGLRKTALWSHAVADGRFSLVHGRDRIKLDIDIE